MNTLADCIIAAKCRKGPAQGTTKRGAYWLAGEPIVIRRYGGDGIGQSAADVANVLELRHYRDGTPAAVIHRSAYHQNGVYGGGGDSWHHMDGLLSQESIEAIIVLLKGTRLLDGDVAAYSDKCKDDLVEGLAWTGLPLAEPSPDDGAR